MLVVMKNLLKNSYDKAETLQGTKLIVALVTIFVVFLSLGFVINNFTHKLLNNNEITNIANDVVSSPNNTSNINNTPSNEETFEGRIVYADPNEFPNENISYYLGDARSKRIILLRSNDQKLEVSEGFSVVVTGKVSKLSDGTQVLDVNSVIVKNN